jgi:hypothetical protein
MALSAAIKEIDLGRSGRLLRVNVAFRPDAGESHSS